MTSRGRTSSTHDGRDSNSESAYFVITPNHTPTTELIGSVMLRGELSDRRLPPVWADRFATRAERDQSGCNLRVAVGPPTQTRSSRIAAEVDDRPTAAPTVVLDLFAHAIGAAKASSRSQSGAPLTVGEAMATYIEDIEQRPSAADEAIRKYTVVYAATCQRSSQYFLPFGQGSNAAGFEHAIVDEAARVSPLDLIIPLVQAKQRVILVGDHRQLPAVYDESIARGLAQADLLPSKSRVQRLFRATSGVGQAYRNPEDSNT